MPPLDNSAYKTEIAHRKQHTTQRFCSYFEKKVRLDFLFSRSISLSHPLSSPVVLISNDLRPCERIKVKSCCATAAIALAMFGLHFSTQMLSGRKVNYMVLHRARGSHYCRINCLRCLKETSPKHMNCDWCAIMQHTLLWQLQGCTGTS